MLSISSSDAAEKWIKKFTVIEETAAKWKPVGLAALQSTLDRDAQDLQARKDIVAEGRKVVSTKTKEFSKLPTEEKLSQVGGILKIYQQYIDEVSKQLKHATELYFDTQKVVGLMVDPVPLLSRLLSDKTVILEMLKSTEELDRKKRELREREAELGELRNQEVTIQQLREELAAAEYGQEEQLQQAAEEDEEKVKSVLRQWQQREQQLQIDMSVMSQECRKYQIQTSELNKQVDSERSAIMEFQAAKETETEGLLSDIDQLTTDLAICERDRARLQQADVFAAEVYQELEGRLFDCQEVLDMKVNVLAKLEVAFRDVDQERKALLLCKKVSDSCSSGRDASTGIHGGSAPTESQHQQHQQEQQHRSEVNRLHATHYQELERLRAELLGSQTEALALKGELELQTALVLTCRKETANLERELRQVMLAAPSASETQVASIADSAIRQLSDTFGSAKDVSAPTARNAGGATTTTTPSSTADTFDLASVLGESHFSSAAAAQRRSSSSAAGGEESGGPQDALTAVVTQRERYRQRLIALEESSKRDQDALKLQVFNVKQENEQLHQYLKNGGGGAVGGSTGSSSSTGAFAIRMPGSHTSVVIQTGLLDRMATVMTRFILTNEVTRRIFLMYLLALHGLVFLTLAAQTFNF